MPGQSGSLKELLRLFEGAVLEALDFSRGRVHDCAKVSKGVLEGRIPTAVSYALIKCSYADVSLNHLDEVERDYLMFKEVLESLRDIPGEPTCLYDRTDAERAESSRGLTRFSLPFRPLSATLRSPLPSAR